jgi:hypothetical protein
VYGAIRSPPPVVVLLFVAVAICGYLVGIRGAPATPGVASGETTRIAYGTGVLLEYPSTWQPTAGAPVIPGLPLAHPLLLAPGGDSTHAGLISGQLPAGEPSPLPSGFLALVRGIPHAEVSDLAGVEAYRYNKVSISGYDRILDIYVVPKPEENPTAIACYASNGFSTYMPQCEQIVAKLGLVGQSSSELSPDADYARRLGGLVGVLDRERLRLRREMRRGSTPAAAARLATALAGRFATAGASLAALEPPLAAGPAQDALTTAMFHARDTYRTLAAAGTAERVASYDAARRQVDAVEAGVDAALESFALLGYNHT